MGKIKEIKKLLAKEAKLSDIQLDKATIAPGYYIVEDEQHRRSIVQVCHTENSDWITSSNFAPDMSIKNSLKHFTFLMRINLDKLELNEVLVT